ncbi:MAG: cupredoxin domain-containing protein [Chloroflexota bacterium]
MQKYRRFSKPLIFLALLAALVLIPAIALGKPEGATREITIHAQTFEYTPRIIRVNQGERVKLTLISDDVTHGLLLETYGVELEAQPQQDPAPSVEFVADKTGLFRFRCTVLCGPLHPFMQGELIVEPYSKLPIAWGLTLFVAFGSVLAVRQWGSDPQKDPLGGWKFELTRFKWLDWLFKQRWFQFALFVPNVFFFSVIMMAAFFGTPVGNANFAIIYVWIVWWAALKFFFIPIGGRSWCMMCPLPLPGEWLDHRSLVKKGREKPLSVARKGWPKSLDNAWTMNIVFLAMALFSAIILTRPLATGIVLSMFIIAAMYTSAKYGKRVFCRYICPVSGFTGMYSMVAPVEIRVRDPEVCKRHTDKTCIAGNENGYGCPWMEYPGNLQRNVNCGMCTECFKTCSQDNLAFNIRPFGSDLFVNKGRGVDEIYNGFIMLSCALIYIAVYLGPWGILKDMANIETVPLFLFYAALFLLANLVIMPGLFYIAVWLGKGLAEGQMTPASEAFAFVPRLWNNFMNLVRRKPQEKNPLAAMNIPVRSGLPSLALLFRDYGYAVIPLGLAGWIAFTVAFAMIDISYAIPLLSDPMGWGWNLFGTANYGWVMYAPHLVPYLQAPILLGGLGVSIYTAYRIGLNHITDKKVLTRSLAPAVILLSLVTATFFWLVL